MPKNLSRLSTALMAFALLSAIPAVQAQERSALNPKNLVVVELFQSQGCSSCPPAEDNLNAIAGEPNVLALSFGVTYWDELGWKDSFATEANTQRQWDYAHHHGRDTVWTPQIYINGQHDLIGNDRIALDDAIGQAQSHGPAIHWSSNGLTVEEATSPPHGSADVWLVRYDPRTLQVPISGGENRGRTLAQRNVVREFVHLGTWNGTASTFPLPASTLKGMKTAALVQVKGGGEILNASVEDVSE